MSYLEVVDQQTIHFKFIRLVLIGVLLGRRANGHAARHVLQEDVGRVTSHGCMFG